jgi:hypothetical protein
MKKYRFITIFLLIALLFSSYTLVDKTRRIYSIPKMTIDLYKILGYDFDFKDHTQESFEISTFVTYAEYKEYLRAVRLDSSEEYYNSQLPDSNIGTNEVRNKYINETQYDNFPVVGISWDNAMNFCKWKTITSNKDSIKYIYRIPHCSEWLSAYHYLSQSRINHDFSRSYSDWLIDSQDDSFHNKIIQGKEPKVFEYIYFHQNEDILALKKKLVIGNSFHIEHESLFMHLNRRYYANEGYKHISFRYIKEPLHNTAKSHRYILKYWNLE